MTGKTYVKLRIWLSRQCSRLSAWRMRRKAARQIGVDFCTVRSFSLPHDIVVNDMPVRLDLPCEEGQITAFVEILLDDCYHLRKLSSSAEIITVIDVGANAGVFSIAARKAFPRAKIHAYEPNPELGIRLRKLAEQIDFTYYAEAIGRKNGMVKLVTQPGLSIMTKTVADEAGPNIQISLRSALHRIGGNVDLLKLDCEGAEWELFKDRSAWAKVRYLTMEYHLDPGEDHCRIFKALDVEPQQVVPGLSEATDRRFGF